MPRKALEYLRMKYLMPSNRFVELRFILLIINKKIVKYYFSFNLFSFQITALGEKYIGEAEKMLQSKQTELVGK
jgi:hypothetical protein